jgi:hypothetical protein
MAWEGGWLLWGFGGVEGCLGTWVLVSVPAVVGMRHGVPACKRRGGSGASQDGLGF